VNGFVLDENVPGRLAFRPCLPVVSSREVVGGSATDAELWEYARRHRLVLVTKDADFSDRIFMNTPPPWIVHLRVGNLCRRDFHALLQALWPRIEACLPRFKMVAVYKDRIEAVE